MPLGLNLSFAVKRFTNPYMLAKMCNEEFGIKYVQLTWDLINPWWPDNYRSKIINNYKDAFLNEGIEITSTFGGVASYTFGQLLSFTETERKISLEFFKRAVDMTVEIGAKVMGTPVGGMSYEDAKNQHRRAELYRIMIEYLYDLASYGKETGLKEIQIEATPLITEFPHNPDMSLKMMNDLNETEIPIKLLIDWGHALFKPLLQDDADMGIWLMKCKPHVGGIHLQQTDGLWDRHWDFTEEGLVTEEKIRSVIYNYGIEDVIQYLEVVTIFEENDDVVLAKMKKSMEFLNRVFNNCKGDNNNENCYRM